MCGGGGSASNDDEKQNQTAVFKKNDNPMTGYNPGDIVQERLDPVGNPTQAPKNYPGTNIAKGTTNLMTNTNGSNDRSDTAKDNRVSGALLEQGARTAMYMANASKTHYYTFVFIGERVRIVLEGRNIETWNLYYNFHWL